MINEIVCTQIKYGYLLACFKAVEKSYCLVQLMTLICERGYQVKNDLDCPLYTLSFTLFVISSSDVLSPVSFVHEFQHCSLTTKHVSVIVERESTTTEKLINIFVLTFFVLTNEFYSKYY